MKVFCDTCKFWDQGSVRGMKGECRRFPPVIAWGLGQNGLDLLGGTFPQTLAGEWCGEHSPDKEPR